jgi:uncharacterized protein (TIGR03437 family)
VASDAFSTTAQPFAPLLFKADGNYPEWTDTDADGVPTKTHTAKPGDTMVLYGTGFGPVTPASSCDLAAERLGLLTTPLVIAIGGVQATIFYAGLGGGLLELYPLVVAQLAGMGSPSTDGCCCITVRR